MNKEIKDRLDKLENELKESKNEIHNLKSSVSLTIERGIRKLLSRFTRKQLLLGSVIALFSISIIGIAGTVTKTYTFSSGEVVSASKFNTNFDTLFTLVNGNLDDNNISGISGSKITSGTVAAARIDNLSGSKITSGTVAAARIDNLDGSKITSGTVAAARLDNLSATMITSGTIDGARIDNVSSTAINYGDGIFIYTSYAKGKKFEEDTIKTQLKGEITRTTADNACLYTKMKIKNRTCNNVRAFISLSSSDEIRDMPSNYSVPENEKVYNQHGHLVADNFSSIYGNNNNTIFYSNFVDGTLHGDCTETNGDCYFWIGGGDGAFDSSNTCNNWTHGSSNYNGNVYWGTYNYFYTMNRYCHFSYALLCLCY